MAGLNPGMMRLSLELGLANALPTGEDCHPTLTCPRTPPV